MADLRDREVAVSEKNDTQYGPSGRRKRSIDSLYLLVGGSSCAYDVTVNFESTNGHWCQNEAGDKCFGNIGKGKTGKYGIASSRDKRDPIQWCKHIQAALAATEALAEASDRTAIAFGKVAKSDPKPECNVDDRFDPVAANATVTANARERLAELEAEASALRSAVAVTDKVVALVDEFGFEAVKAALGSTAVGKAA